MPRLFERRATARRTSLSIRGYLETPVEAWVWPMPALQPCAGYCDADLAWFRRPIG